MTVAKITGQGLAAITLAVASLWTCIIAEQILVRNADADNAQTMRAVRELRLRRSPEPVCVPTHSRRDCLRAKLG
ncbi:MAG TPA: hypothetical protein VMT86_10210 [Bryobacteraceae bacterium]|nr:hypothetical protein [Bryobacteraceae bacterium]